MAVVESLKEFSAMKGGDGSFSYSKNSEFQRLAASVEKEKIDEEISMKLDIKQLSSVSNTISLADLGCATGPNTFIAMENIIEAIKLKHNVQCPNSSEPLEFQVFFNDRPFNDFNYLFASLPPSRHYFAAGVPGSFHGRLFPKSSIHFVYTCHALHWLSKLPEELSNEDSPAWNKGRIHYAKAPREVHNAFASQFYKDIENFLDYRAKEIVAGGMMVLLMAGIPNGTPVEISLLAYTFDLIGSAFMELAKENIISEALVDSFNIPIYEASPEEMSGLIEKNGHFSVERIEFTKPKSSLMVDQIVDTSIAINHFKAGFEGLLSQHFGSENTDKMFKRLSKRFVETSEEIASIRKKSGQLLVVLKRK